MESSDLALASPHSLKRQSPDPAQEKWENQINDKLRLISKANKEIQGAFRSIKAKGNRLEVKECMNDMLLKLERDEIERNTRRKYEQMMLDERWKFEHEKEELRLWLEEEHSKKEIQMIQWIQTAERDAMELKEKQTLFTE